MVPPAFFNFSIADFDIKSASILTFSLISPEPRILSLSEFLLISFSFFNKEELISSPDLILFLSI